MQWSVCEITVWNMIFIGDVTQLSIPFSNICNCFFSSCPQHQKTSRRLHHAENSATLGHGRRYDRGVAGTLLQTNPPHPQHFQEQESWVYARNQSKFICSKYIVLMMMEKIRDWGWHAHRQTVAAQRPTGTARYNWPTVAAQWLTDGHCSVTDWRALLSDWLTGTAQWLTDGHCSATSGYRSMASAAHWLKLTSCYHCFSELRRRYRLQPAATRKCRRSNPGDARGIWMAGRRGRLHQHQVHGPHLRILLLQLESV